MSLKGYKPKSFEAYVGKALADYGRTLKADPDSSIAPYLAAIKRDFPDADMKNVGLMLTSVRFARAVPRQL